jgi:hypothetical protein
MTGGVDTVMPDKIVKRVVNDILVKAGLEPVEDDIEFVKRAEQIALACGYRPIELCWMTWLIQPEGRKIRMEKYKRHPAKNINIHKSRNLAERHSQPCLLCESTIK